EGAPGISIFDGYQDGEGCLALTGALSREAVEQGIQVFGLMTYEVVGRRTGRRRLEYLPGRPDHCDSSAGDAWYLRGGRPGLGQGGVGTVDLADEIDQFAGVHLWLSSGSIPLCQEKAAPGSLAPRKER